MRFVLFVMGVVGCAQPPEPPPPKGEADEGRPQAESCQEYLGCLLEYDPSTYGEVVDAFGADGSCWQGSAAGADECAEACAAGFADSFCGPESQANVAACEAFVDALDDCEGIDVSPYRDD